ncbi:UPF0104 family protein [Allostella humosa]|uniref:UPF0104 family protein n=1 Tax=Stella humosa TaxID=94 RepID=UPI0018D74CE1|nr:UPF0104 family protein [Stella humosa]
MAAYLLRRIYNEYGWDEISRSVAEIPIARLAGAAAFAAASYFCLTLFDFLAVRSAGHRLAYRRTALASFSALSIGHTVGLAVLSSGAIRYRFYSGWGLKAGDVAKVILFCAITVGLGLATLGGIALVAAPELAVERLGIGAGWVRAVGACALLAPLAYLALCAFVRGELRLRQWHVALPPLKLGLAQVAIGPVNLACVAGCLHQALAATTDIAYLQLLGVYVVANVTALVSHVPGGLGVIESVVLALVPGANVVGGLVLFRLTYFLVPFLIGLLVLAVAELARRVRPGR